MLRCNLPREIVTPDQKILKPVIGGYVGGKFFIKPLASINEIITEAQKQKRKYRTIKILARNLRGKLDYHGIPYQPNTFVFVQI